MATPPKSFANPVLFICDLQEKFRPAIYGFDKVVLTAQKMLKASHILNIPTIATTQNSARLGPLVNELNLDPDHPAPTTETSTLIPPPTTPVLIEDKTLFSMLTPTLLKGLNKLKYTSTGVRIASGHNEQSDTDMPREIILLGIESHICITQTALELKRLGHKVFVLADGVSSCNVEEIPIALARLRSEGVTVTSSESVIYEIVGDAGSGEFKAVAGLVKEFKGVTTEGLKALAKV